MVKSKNTKYRKLRKISGINAKRKRMSFKIRGGSSLPATNYIDYRDVDDVIDIILSNTIAPKPNGDITPYHFYNDHYVLWKNTHKGICIQSSNDFELRNTDNKYCISRDKEKGFIGDVPVDDVNAVKDFFRKYLPSLCILFRPFSTNQLFALLSLCEIENDTSEISRYKYPIQNNHIQCGTQIATICKNIGYESYVLPLNPMQRQSQIEAHKIAVLAILLGKRLNIPPLKIKSDLKGYYYIELNTEDHYRIITNMFETTPFTPPHPIITEGIAKFKKHLNDDFTILSSQKPVNPLLISPEKQKNSVLSHQGSFITVDTVPPISYPFIRADYSQQVSKSIDIFRHLISRFKLVNMLSYNPDNDTLHQSILNPNELICFSTIYNMEGSIIGYQLSNIGVILLTSSCCTNHSQDTLNSIIKRLYTYRTVVHSINNTSYYILKGGKVEEISLFHILMPANGIESNTATETTLFDANTFALQQHQRVEPLHPYVAAPSQTSPFQYSQSQYYSQTQPSSQYGALPPQGETHSLVWERPEPLPANWIEATAADGHSLYYVNTSTNPPTSVWERPKPLPYGWVESITTDGLSLFYVNTTTNPHTSVWERPKPLPYGWVESTTPDKSGLFYVNTSTTPPTSQWKRPI